MNLHHEKDEQKYIPWIIKKSVKAGLVVLHGNAIPSEKNSKFLLMIKMSSCEKQF